jgi:uncharacterized protein (DUF305 family)
VDVFYWEQSVSLEVYESHSNRRFAMLKVFLAAAFLIAVPAIASANHATNAKEAFKEVNDAMTHHMAGAPLTGDADKDFAMMMIPHHQGAIDMANIELKYGKDETLRAMAKMIVEAQEKEIKEIQDWQAKHQ